MSKLLIVVFIVAMACSVWGDSTGYVNPTAATDEGDWANPTYVYSSDNSHATVNAVNQHILRAIFELNITSGSTIDGMRVAVEGKEVFLQNGDTDVALGVSGYTPSSGWGTITTFGTVDAVKYVGASDSLWGLTWNTDSTNSANFSVLLRDANATAQLISIDQIQVCVWYTLPVPTVPMVTTWYSETNDASSKGETNPSTHHVTWEPTFWWKSAIDSIRYYDMDVIDTSACLDTDSTIWASGWVDYADTFYADEYCDSVIFPDTAGTRLQSGHNYKWRVRLASVDGDTTEYCSYQTFGGVSPIEWYDDDYYRAAEITLGDDHDTVFHYTPMELTFPAGYSHRIADDSPEAGGGQACQYRGYSYVTRLGTDGLDVERSALQSYLIRMRDSTTGLWEAEVRVNFMNGDNHHTPTAYIADSTLFLTISGHHDEMIMNKTRGKHVNGSGIDITDWYGSCAQVDSGSDSTLIDENHTWPQADSLDGWKIKLIMGDGGVAGLGDWQVRNIDTVVGETVFVATDFDSIPNSDCWYDIYYEIANVPSSTYPHPIVYEDTLVYVFYRYSYGASLDEPDTSSGTCTSVEDSFMVDTGANWINGYYEGVYLKTTTPNNDMRIIKNTSDSMFFDTMWADKPSVSEPYTLYWEGPHPLSYIIYNVRSTPAEYSDTTAFWGNRHIYIYNDCITPPYSGYGTGFHNTVESNNYILSSNTFWERYGTTGQGGRGLAVLYCKPESDYDLLYWCQFNGAFASDTVGQSQTDMYYRVDTTINWAACTKKVAVCADIVEADSQLIGTAQRPHYDVSGDSVIPMITYQSFRADTNKSGFRACELYFARYWDGSWNIDSLSDYGFMGDSVFTWNFRTGGDFYIKNNIVHIISFGAPISLDKYQGAELYEWTGNNIVSDNMLWSVEPITVNSGGGVPGRINVMNNVPANIDNQYVYGYGNDLIWSTGKSYSSMQSDGGDIKIVIYHRDDTGTVTYFVQQRLADNQFGRDSCTVLWNHNLNAGIPANQRSLDSKVIRMHSYNRGASTPTVLVDRSDGTSGLYDFYESFETYPYNYILNSDVGWTIDPTDSVRVFDYTYNPSNDKIHWTYNLTAGAKYAVMNGHCSARFNAYGKLAHIADNHVLEIDIEFGSVASGTGYDSAMTWFGIEDTNQDTIAIGYINTDGSAPQLIINNGYTTGWIDADTTFGPTSNRMMHVDFVIGDYLVNGKVGIIGYLDDVLIFQSDDSDTMLSDDNTATGNSGIFCDTEDIDNDEFNNQWIKMLEGNNAGDVRQIHDCDGSNERIYPVSAWDANNASGNAFLIFNDSSGFAPLLKYCYVVNDSGNGSTVATDVLFEHLICKEVLTNPSEQTLFSPADAIAGSYRDKILRRRWEY